MGLSWGWPYGANAIGKTVVTSTSSERSSSLAGHICLTRLLRAFYSCCFALLTGLLLMLRFVLIYIMLDVDID